MPIAVTVRLTIRVSFGRTLQANCDTRLTYYRGQNTSMAGTDTMMMRISSGSPMRQ